MRTRTTPRRTRPRRRPARGKTIQHPAAGGWIWGTHAVIAALKNPQREVRRIVGTPEAFQAILDTLAPQHPVPEVLAPPDIDRILGPGTVHQGLAVHAADLPAVDLRDLAARSGPILMLDQVTDPHNVGAVLRSASAFGCAGVVMQERHSPPLFGALTKSASGAAETVPVARVTNLARTLGELAELGYWRIGLAGGSADRLDRISIADRVVLVAGAEGTGLRRLTAENCDVLARIAMTDAIESLNVSNAVAIALYEVFRRND